MKLSCSFQVFLLYADTIADKLFKCVWTFCGVRAYRIKIKKMNILLSAPKMNSSTHLNEMRHFPVLSPTVHKNQDFFIIFQNIKKILRNEDHIFLDYDNIKKIKKIVTSGYCTWTMLTWRSFIKYVRNIFQKTKISDLLPHGSKVCFFLRAYWKEIPSTGLTKILCNNRNEQFDTNMFELIILDSLNLTA